MQVSFLEEADIAECLNIYNYYIENTCFTLEEDALRLADFRDRCLAIREKYPFLVVKNEEGKVLGYAYLSAFNPRSAYRRTADLSIYVDRDHTHEKLGVLLLSEIEKAAGEWGITTLISIITDENRNSVRFHERNGFILEGTLHDVAYKFHRSLSVFYYRKALCASGGRLDAEKHV